MPLEHILINLKRELIRTFAVVDEWFDKEHALRCHKPLPGAWSINEVLEHVMLTNHYLLIIIDNGRVKSLRKRQLLDAFTFPEDYSLGNEAMLQIAQPEAFSWQRPEHHQPTGQMGLYEIRREIRNQLDKCLITMDFLPNGEGILHRTSMVVNNLGKLDVYQYIYFLILHAQRHLRQMEKNEKDFLRMMEGQGSLA